MIRPSTSTLPFCGSARGVQKLSLGRSLTLLLAGTLGMGCSVAHTPAEPTPVYASALPQAQVVPVERLSVNRPDPHLASSTPGSADPIAPAPSAPVEVPGAPSADSAPEDTVAPPATSSNSAAPSSPALSSPPKGTSPPASTRGHVH